VVLGVKENSSLDEVLTYIVWMTRQNLGSLRAQDSLPMSDAACRARVL
jgi:hypothetical protein